MIYTYNYIQWGLHRPTNITRGQGDCRAETCFAWIKKNEDNPSFLKRYKLWGYHGISPLGSLKKYGPYISYM